MTQIPIFGTLFNVTDGKVASAAQVTFTPPAGMSSTNVQSAIVEALGKAGQWHLGTEINTDNSTTVVPGASVGDLYLNTDTTNAAFGNVYQLTNVSGTNKWVKKLNITSKATLSTSTDAQNYSHAYLSVTNGGVTTTSPDLMAPVNSVLTAIDDILNPSTASLTASSTTE
jgi:hypothetical protein